MQAIRIYLRLQAVNIRSQLQYRASLAMDILSTMLLSTSYFLPLGLVIQRFGNVAGWNLGQIAFLAGMAELSFGVMDMFFSGFDPDVFSPMVRLGRFDQMLLRPINITLQVLGSQFILRRLGRILEGATILAISFFLTDIHWTIGRVVYLPLVLISQIVAMGAIFIAGSTLIFWTVQPIEAVNILTYGGNELMTYPMSIYPAPLRRFFTYVIPFAFMNYYPALYFLGKPDPLGLPWFAPFMAPFVALVMLWLALRFWAFGVRSYQSTGS